MIKSNAKIANIEPLDEIDFTYNRSHHSFRSSGSFIQILKKPTKYLEFTRSYVTGDPINFIDWKIYGRTENLILRENREESSCCVKIIVDLSPTMNWPSDADCARFSFDVKTKQEVAFRLALNMAYRHASGGDFVDIVLIGSAEPKIVRVKSPSEMQIIFSSFLKKGFSKEILLDYAISSELKTERRYLIEYLISDLIGFLPETHFSDAKHKFVLHLLSSLEVGIDWVDSKAKYAESHSSKVEYDGSTIAKQYPNELNRWRVKIKDSCKNNGLSYIGINDSTSIFEFESHLVEAIT